MDQREKSRQRLTEYNKSKGVSIEILDTTTDEVLSYSSIRQAAEALGCVHRTILLAERKQKEGISKLIKKRYLIKTIRREYHSFTRSSVQAINIEQVGSSDVKMGDGYFADGSIKICTDNFTKEEVLRLIEVLHVKYGIKASINQRTNPGGVIKWRIRISKLSMDKLISLVRPYFIPEMLYKLGLN